MPRREKTLVDVYYDNDMLELQIGEHPVGVERWRVVLWGVTLEELERVHLLVEAWMPDPSVGKGMGEEVEGGC